MYLKVHNLCNQRNKGFNSLRWLFYGALCDFFLTLWLGLNELALTDMQRSELGRFTATKTLADLGKFKTPSLRNIALTAPYMHDGSIKTLEKVIEHYDKGGDKNRFIDAKIFPLHLTQQEKADLVAFMQTLTSSPVSLD